MRKGGFGIRDKPLESVVGQRYVGEHMFDLVVKAGQAPPLDLGEWTADDDAMVAALTEAALAEDALAEAPEAPEEPLSRGLPVEMLVALLGGPQVERGQGLVETMRAHARAVAYHQARLLESMMSIVDEYLEEDPDPALAMEGAATEVRAALSLTRRAAESDLDLAWSLRNRLPAVLAALRAGRIDLRRAWVINDGTSHLDDSQARAVATQVLDRAEGRTTGQLRALIRRLCLEVDPEDARHRHVEALEERKVVAELTESSTGTITATDLPPERVAAAMDRLTKLAQGLRGDGEPRTIDQLRADVFLDLLEGKHVGGARGTIDIRVDLTTLAGLDENSAELAGFGPVVADIARQMTERHGPSWRFTVTDGLGSIVGSGITRRRPTSSLRRLVEARDLTCVFPGCRMPASQCDLDHRIRVVDGGVTDDDQLVALCRHDHVVRHRHGWTHARNTDGSHTWKSPLGVEYIRPPPV